MIGFAQKLYPWRHLVLKIIFFKVFTNDVIMTGSDLSPRIHTRTLSTIDYLFIWAKNKIVRVSLNGHQSQQMTPNNCSVPLLMFLRKLKKMILKIFKNFGFFGSEGHVWGPITFFARCCPTLDFHQITGNPKASF